MSTSPESAAWERARGRVAQLRHFYIHALAFVLGNTVGFVVNWLTLGDGQNPWWFQWGLLVWSTALAVHALTLAGRGRLLGPAWERRKIEQYLQYLHEDVPDSPDLAQ